MLLDLLGDELGVELGGGFPTTGCMLVDTCKVEVDERVDVRRVEGVEERELMWVDEV